ncbi:MAG: ribonuclease HI family protein [Elusimicrobia bacterium]|nr:ribonuclease HI family protein [Elusimicrobiota bacterium]
MSKGASCKLYTDGACWGNPGPASAGAVIYDDAGREIYKGAVYIGEATNNIAEYTAILEGLRAASRLGITSLKVYSDSELVIRQLNNQYKVKSEQLGSIKKEIAVVAGKFSFLEYRHLEREKTDVPHKLAENILKNRQ